MLDQERTVLLYVVMKTDTAQKRIVSMACIQVA